MSDGTQLVQPSKKYFSRHRARVDENRERARELFDGGATGIQVAASLSEATDALIVEIFNESLTQQGEPSATLISEHCALVSLGGSGRGELAPYSDYDLLFLFEEPAAQPFADCTARVVRDCWDAGISLGHAVRSVGDTIGMAKHELEIATSLVEARLLWGSNDLFENLQHKTLRRVIRSRLKTFVDECLIAREQERERHGATVSQLEPDVKRSLGGLRDIHLIRWLGLAYFGTSDINSLRLQGALSRDDARLLLAAHEFLTRVRIEMHFEAGKSQDLLTREEQLRITKKRNIEPYRGQRPVERFMKTYFRHSSTIAQIAQRFADRYRPQSAGKRLVRWLVSHHAGEMYRVAGNTIDIVPRYCNVVCGSLDQLLKFYYTALLYGAQPAFHAVEAIKTATISEPLTDESAGLFINILRRGGYLGSTLRNMHATGVLERVIPAMKHARCLLQFNQYHSFTVDEHTLRAIEAVESFEQDDGPLGSAYRAIGHKEILHLALLLHDLGKGFEEAHSDVGKQIAEQTAARLRLPDHHRDVLVFLVHKHLKMAHLAFRRDITDPETLLEFSQEVGSPETLRMLYVLTAADIIAVGPGRWTGWKAELLSDLYDRAMLELSGKHSLFLEEERLEQVKRFVENAIVPVGGADETLEWKDWIHTQLDSFPPHYLSATSPNRIAADLDTVRQFQPGDLVVAGRYEPETGTMEFRIITRDNDVSGCFHKSAGALAAMRLEILSAQISTSADGIVIDSYRVFDHDFEGRVPRERIKEIKTGIRQVLENERTVEELFQRNVRFTTRRAVEQISDMPMRVVLDNDSSDRCTIIDVFAHDRPGLLYTVTRAIFELNLSVRLAKIATHLDQVVDVFYVIDTNGQKIKNGEMLKNVRLELTTCIESFERTGHHTFKT